MTGTRKRYNDKALLLALYHVDGNYAQVQFFCRPVKTFVVGSTRFYHVKPCNSIDGKPHETAAVYCYAQDQLRDTGRRFSRDGAESKRT